MIANFIKYTLFIIRRERINSVIWIISMVFSVALFTSLYPGLFPSKEAMISMSTTMDTPAMVAMMGPVYGLDKISSAITMAHECLIWIAIAAIIMNIFFVNRHTRVDEELGRQEMLASLPIGYLTGSVATIVCAFGMNLIISLLSAVSIIVLNIEGTTVAGAFSYTLSIGMQGFLFAAITLLAAQLFSTANASMGVSFGMMGLFYVLRAMGDMSDNALSYISPMGLGLKVEAFYTNDFMPVIILFAEAVVILLIALAVKVKRDVGAGIFPAKKGRANASRFLNNPFGLAWKLTKKSFLIWAVSFLVLSALYGSIIGEIETFVKGNDAMRQVLEGSAGGSVSLVDAFIPMLCCIMAMLSSIPVINTMNHLRVEEKRGRLEQIYSKSVSRSVLFICFTVIAVMEAVIFTFLSVFGLYLTSSVPLEFDMLMAATFVQLPAILLMAGLVALLVGLLPKFTAIVWVLFGYSFLMLYFGRLFADKIPEWMLKISPFGNVPQMPIEEFTAAPLIILSVIAIIMYGLGFISYMRRDIV